LGWGDGGVHGGNGDEHDAVESWIVVPKLPEMFVIGVYVALSCDTHGVYTGTLAVVEVT
jgi:hypothetical protein